jgi:CDP-glucose 4,6-dehydratase
LTIDQQFWSGKKVLITGNTGFKGSWLTLFLKNLGAEIYGVSREEKEGIYKLANVHKIINKQLIYDIASNDTSDLDNFVKTVNPDVIFHFAAQSLVYVGYVNPIDTLNTNVIGTYNVLNSIKKTSNLNSVVVSTTDKVYRDSSFENIESSPLGGKDFYSSSKVGTENVISAFLSFNNSFNISTVRSGNVIGGGDRAEKRLVTDLINALITNSDFTLRKPKSIRPWQSVLDSILGYLLVAQNSYKKK